MPPNFIIGIKIEDVPHFFFHTSLPRFLVSYYLPYFHVKTCQDCDISHKKYLNLNHTSVICNYYKNN